MMRVVGPALRMAERPGVASFEGCWSIENLWTWWRPKTEVGNREFGKGHRPETAKEGSHQTLSRPMEAGCCRASMSGVDKVKVRVDLSGKRDYTTRTQSSSRNVSLLKRQLLRLEAAHASFPEGFRLKRRQHGCCSQAHGRVLGGCTSDPARSTWPSFGRLRTTIASIFLPLSAQTEAAASLQRFPDIIVICFSAQKLVEVIGKGCSQRRPRRQSELRRRAGNAPFESYHMCEAQVTGKQVSDDGRECRRNIWEEREDISFQRPPMYKCFGFASITLATHPV